MNAFGRMAAAVLGWAACVGALAAQDADWHPDTKGWLPLPLDDLLVKEGSALDFSSLVEPGPSGKHGFLKIDARGWFVFEGEPEKPLRFFCTSHPMEYWGPETPEEIAEFARQIRLAGYNCYRAHYLDLMLMDGTKDDLVPNPKQLDRWDHLCAELKKQGVYLYVDISSIWTSYYAIPVRGQAWGPAGRAVNLYGRMYWETEAREHWAKGAKLLLEHVNPYTGLALKDDPQVIGYVLRNEAGLHFLLAHLDPDGAQEKGLAAPFRAWLRKKYPDVAALNRAWSPAAPYATFDDVAVPPREAREGTAPTAADFERFLVDSELETLGWMRDAVAKIGPRVPVQDFNVGVAFAHNLSRSAQPMVETHSYHDHPSAYISPGSTMPNQSAVGQGLPFLSWANEVRQLDRPFLVTEWGYPYWNQWRFEAGLTMPAYGAFQGWQLLNQSHEPIKLKVETPLRPFKIPYDPGGKLAERMAALLYARGDVAPARHTVEVDLDPGGVFDRWGGEGYMPGAVRRLPLWVRSGIRIVGFPAALPGAPVKADAVLKISPTRRAIVWADAPDGADTPSEAEMAAALRKRGILPEGNRTDVAAGVFQSDTGELTVDKARRLLTVDTPRSQGATFPAEAGPVRLHDLDIANQGAPGCFFVGSLDARPLAESRRLLVLAAGDAVNTGAAFAGPDRRVLRELGTLPVLVQPLRAEITLRRRLPPGAKAHLWALAFNGDRVREVPVTASADGLVLKLDTAADEGGAAPVLQYELVIE